MDGHRSNKKAKVSLALLATFGIAMALLEAAVVVYMRRLYYPENPLELFPLRFLNHYDPPLELSREVATIAMILTVAFLAERRTPARTFAAFVFVFGAWDLFYYVWLKVLMGWPQDWLEWDVLFLIPTVWLGPWICPAAIALLFVLWGGHVVWHDLSPRLSGVSLATFMIGAALGLVTFMQPAWFHPFETLAEYTPQTFWWWLFLPSYLLMCIGLAMSIRAPSSSGSASLAVSTSDTHGERVMSEESVQ